MTAVSESPVEEGSRRLHRDNLPFKFWQDQGRPELPADCAGPLPIIPVLALIEASASKPLQKRGQP